MERMKGVVLEYNPGGVVAVEVDSCDFFREAWDLVQDSVVTVPVGESMSVVFDTCCLSSSSTDGMTFLHVAPDKSFPPDAKKSWTSVWRQWVSERYGCAVPSDMYAGAVPGMFPTSFPSDVMASHRRMSCLMEAADLSGGRGEPKRKDVCAP